MEIKELCPLHARRKKNSSKKGLSWTVPQSWHVCAVRDLKIKHWADVKALVFQSELYRQTINRKRNDQKTKSLLQYLDPSRLMDCTDVIFCLDLVISTQ